MITVRHPRRRDWAQPVIALSAIIPALHLMGSGPLAAPPLHDSLALQRWLSDSDAIVASFSILRLGALVLAYHLAATLLLAGSGRILRRRSLVDLARRVAPSAYRGMIERVAGITLSTTILLGTPVPVSADAPTTAVSAVEQTAEHPPGTATMRLDPPTGRAELRLLESPTTELGEVPRAKAAEPIVLDGPDEAESERDSATSTTSSPPSSGAASTTTPDSTTTSGPDRTTVPDIPGETASPAPVGGPVSSDASNPRSAGSSTSRRVAEPLTGEHVVEPGDHLWALAEERLADHLGRAVTDQEIAPYWRRVVGANPQLADPDLIFPGDVVELPDPA